MKLLFTLFALVLAGSMVSTTSLAAESTPKRKQDLSQYPNTGTVLSILDTDMYTYIEISGKTDKDPSVWLATTKVKVAKGDAVRYGAGNVMTNFSSKSLNRTFPTLIMIDKVLVVKAGA